MQCNTMQYNTTRYNTYIYIYMHVCIFANLYMHTRQNVCRPRSGDVPAWKNAMGAINRCVVFIHGVHGRKGHDNPEMNPSIAARRFIMMSHRDESSWSMTMEHHDASSQCPIIDDSAWWAIVSRHGESIWLIVMNENATSSWCISMVHHHDS